MKTYRVAVEFYDAQRGGRCSRAWREEVDDLRIIHMQIKAIEVETGAPVLEQEIVEVI